MESKGILYVDRSGEARFYIDRVEAIRRRDDENRFRFAELIFQARKLCAENGQRLPARTIF